MRVLFLAILFLCVSLSSCGVKKSLEHRPENTSFSQADTTSTKHSETYYTLGNNSLKKNKHGLWEMYVEGKALERGLAIGSMSRELMHTQERAFFGKISSMVGSPTRLDFLAKITKWFNRKMYLHVPDEYETEIYGISRFGLHEYDGFAKPFVRFLYYHGAHDIGHALQDLMLVGCTSFAAWGEKTADGQLLLGRNFDFYINDEFSEEKIIAFINPDQGHKFMIYTWGGMLGAVSGMNEQGLTVTINAAKSKIPLIAKTPISLVAREILQYAKNIEEATAIAKKREVFVSESIMIGSALDKKAVIIEVAPHKMDVYEVENSNTLVCSNHFQSEGLKDSKRNLKQKEKGHTRFRYKRMAQLLDQNEKLGPKKAVDILRNQKGVNDIRLGMGNERAINQLLSHHGIVFKPEEKLAWVSTNPYNLGEYVAYDLDVVFKKFKKGKTDVSSEELLISEDPFIHSRKFQDYEEYRDLRKEIRNAIKKEENIPEEKLSHFKSLNPRLWSVYFLTGKYYFEKKQYKKALIDFKQALRREVTTKKDVETLKTYIKKCSRKI